MNNLATIENTDTAFEITDTGLRITRQLSYDEWTQFGRMLVTQYNKLKWVISDWLAYGDDAYGDDIYQFIDELWSEQTIANYTSTARRIPPPERRADVAFSNHSEVASLDAENRKHALDMLASKEWTRQDVREFKRELKGVPQAVEETISLQYRAHTIKDGILTVSFIAPDEVWHIVDYKAIVRKVPKAQPLERAS